MNSSLSQVFVAICGSSFVIFTSGIKVGMNPDPGADTYYSEHISPQHVDFFEFVYGINQQAGMSGTLKKQKNWPSDNKTSEPWISKNLTGANW